MHISFFDAFLLCGLTVQIIASFILSVEVIGLDRVAGWMKSLSILRRDLIDEARGYEVSRRSQRVVRFVCGMSAMMGALIVFRFAHHPGMNFNQRSYLGYAGLVIGGLLGIVLQQALAYGLGLAVLGLQKLETQSRARTSGIIGFSLLFFGFVLQFVGTIGQVLSKQRLPITCLTEALLAVGEETEILSLASETSCEKIVHCGLPRLTLNL